MEESQKNINNYAQAYFEVFIISMLIVWLPSKLLAYTAPFIGIIWFIIRSRSGKSLLRFVFGLFFYLAIIGLYKLLYYFYKEEFVIQNAFLSLFTYGSFFFFLVLPPNGGLQNLDYRKYAKVIAWFILIEASLGIFQVLVYVLINSGNFDSGTGDVVQGTLNPMSFIDPGGSFNNQIYCANLLVLLLFYAPFVISQKKGILVSCIGLLAVIFASVMHLFIVFIVAVVLITLYMSRSFIKFNTNKLIIAVFLVIAIVVTISFQPRNVALIGHYFNNIQTDESPKTVATKKTLLELPDEYPWVYFTGLGPGQYASRAGLIGTGHYFGEFKNPKQLPFIDPKNSPALHTYIFKDWESVATNPAKYGNSTMSRPFYSTLSILTEFGYLMFFCILFMMYVFVRRIKKMYIQEIKERNFLRSLYGLSCGALVVFYFFISFFENYMEVTQAIFPGLLLLYYFYSFLKNSSSSNLA